jgi:hypothetical protein
MEVRKSNGGGNLAASFRTPQIPFSGKSQSRPVDGDIDVLRSAVNEAEYPGERRSRRTF